MSHGDDVQIRIETARPPSSDLVVHVTESDAEEVFEHLRGNGLSVQGPLVELAIPEIVEIAMYAIGPSTGLMAGLRAYWHQNDKKNIKLRINGMEVDLTGYSQEQAEAFFAARKKDWDDQWHNQK